MTLPGYFWDRWPYFAGKLSWDITTTQVNSALHPSGVAKSSTSFGWGKGGKVTSAGWQVTLYDLIWHARSGVVISITNCYIRFTFYFTLIWLICMTVFPCFLPEKWLSLSNTMIRFVTYFTYLLTYLSHAVPHNASCGKSSESVQCAITGPCLRMRHRPSAWRTVPIRKICPSCYSNTL